MIKRAASISPTLALPLDLLAGRVPRMMLLYERKQYLVEGPLLLYSSILQGLCVQVMKKVGCRIKPRSLRDS